MSEIFCLRWNDFQSNITSTFSQFQTKTYFQDVTLVSDDHKQISAHRVILSAGSGYFNHVLSGNAHSHPLLCLDGINSSELNNVIDFIYTGELQLYQENLDRFLQIAQKLQLQGIQSSEENGIKEKIETKYDAVVAESDSMNFTEHIGAKKIISMTSEDFQSIEELDSYIEKQIMKTEEGFTCNICNKTGRLRSNIKEHIEIHIDGLTFDCNICGKIMGTRNALRMHKKKIHKNCSSFN